MKTIKIIELLNKIANGEEVPKKIAYKNEIRYYVDSDKDYMSHDSKYYYLFYNIFKNGTGESFQKALNDEVEIIEEDKKIEKLEKYYEFEDIDNNEDNKKYKEYYENILKVYGTGEYEIDEALSFTIDKINELVDEINKLKENKDE